MSEPLRDQLKAAFQRDPHVGHPPSDLEDVLLRSVVHPGKSRSSRERWLPALGAVLAVLVVGSALLARLVVWPATRPASKPAGSQPVIAATPGPSDLQDLKMVDAHDGWDTGRSLVAITHDGAANFTGVTPPHATGEYIIDPPFFLDASHAWVVYGPAEGRAPAFLERTSDGGGTWTRFRLPDAENQLLQFVDPVHGWIVERSSVRNNSANSYTLLRTVDGGASWTPLQQAVLKHDIEPNIQQADCMTWQGVTFITATDGYSGTSCPGGSTPTLEMTHDAGATWTRLNLPNPPAGSGTVMDTQTGVIAFTSPLDLAVSVTRCIGGEGGCSIVGEVYRTTDGGRHWRVGQTVLGFMLVAADPDHLWSPDSYLPGMKPGPNLLLSTDGGGHWSILPEPRQMWPNMHGRTSFQFVSPSRGFTVVSMDMAGTVTFYETLDGGRSFKNFIPRLVQPTP